MLVVFIFLRNVRGTLIPSVAVPVSLIGTFAVMYVFGYSLDNLSLMALTIATGFVVDDAIVVMENISRHLEDGMQPFAAALQGAREIGFTVLTISMSLIAVFIPILADGRDHRPAVPRVRGHALGGDHRFDDRLAHHHADDVRARTQAARSEERELALQAERARLQRNAWRIPQQPDLGAGESGRW